MPVVVELRVAHGPPAEAVAQAQLQHHGMATLRVRAPRRVRARGVLTLADGATPLAVSRELRLGR